MTLDIGVHEPGDAPWWEFHCDDCTTVVKQWMNEAAEVIGQEIANRAAGGLATVEMLHMSLDGMSGHYMCTCELHPNHPRFFVVTRGNQTMEPRDDDDKL
jgi:hypothetical protein